MSGEEVELESQFLGTMAGELHRNTAGKIDIAIESVLMFFVYATLALRLWSRALQRVSLQANDYMIIIATIFMTARFALMVVIVVKCGVGMHIGDVLAVAGPEVLTLLLQCLYAIDILWASLVSIIKLSILHFYLKVFRQRLFHIAVYITMGICAAFWIGVVFAGAFFCNPPQKQWNPDLDGTCGDRTKFTSIPSSTDLAIDCIVILLPMPVLWGLQMPIGKRIGLMAVFSLGFIIIAITGYRIKPMLELDSEDLTYALGTIAVLASIVPLLGIINANLPIMAPAFKKVFKSSALGSTTLKKSTASGDGSKHQFSKLAEPEIPLVHVNSPYDAEQGEITRGEIRVTKNWEVRSYTGTGNTSSHSDDRV